jgi:hypothetical protein
MLLSSLRTVAVKWVAANLRTWSWWLARWIQVWKCNPAIMIMIIKILLWILDSTLFQRHLEPISRSIIPLQSRICRSGPVHLIQETITALYNIIRKVETWIFTRTHRSPYFQDYLAVMRCSATIKTIYRRSLSIKFSLGISIYRTATRSRKNLNQIFAAAFCQWSN